MCFNFLIRRLFALERTKQFYETFYSDSKVRRFVNAT